MTVRDGLKAVWLVVLMSVVVGAMAASVVRAGEEAIDWDKARALLQKENQHRPLTPEEQAYLNHAKEVRSRTTGAPGTTSTPMQPKESWGLTPLTDMGEAKYKGESSGLYGDGSNVPPPAQRKAAEAAAARIRPLDAQGRPAPDGKIVLISIGMSNTTMEFSTFKQMADADVAKSPAVLIVDGAQGAQDASAWVRAEESFTADRPSPWRVLDDRLKAAGASPQQVQAVWTKQALAGPSSLGDFPAHARRLQEDLVQTLSLAKKRFPNLQLAYLSSRIYAGYATTPLNPEPYAYEGAFAVRWVIQAQVAGEPQLNADPARGEVKSPVVLWGPYLWTDGTAGRKSDGMVWSREDCGPDGTHPSRSGQHKVATLLLDFFKSDFSAAPWFAPAPPAKP